MGKVRKHVGKVMAVEPNLEAIAQTERAELRMDIYRRHFEISVEQVTGLSKWITASLFAANSGGLLTLLNQAEHITLPLWSGGMFIGGIIFSLLSATANQEVYNRMSEPLGDMIAYWGEVRITGQQDMKVHDAIANRIRSYSRWAWTGPTLGWLSGITFIGGTIAVAVGLPSLPTS